VKSPIDSVKGKITDYDPRTNELTIKAYYPDWQFMLKRKYSECEIRLIDGRQLSDKQRKAVYALLREISQFTGQGLSSTKEAMKQKFFEEELHEFGEANFSLSDAPVSLVCAFQRYLVSFMLEYDIPCSFSLLDFVDDVGAYIYSCLASKKCCICGKRSDLHHVDHVGIGRDREEIIHEGMEALPLCRPHHTEAHTIGQKTFEEKYHLSGGIVIDKYICRRYGLKEKEDVKC